MKNKNLSENNIEILVLDLLQKGSLSTLDLIEEISKERKNTTKQGVYRVLRKLNDEEKIVIHNKLVSLNLHFIKKMNDFFSLAQYYYLPQISNLNNFLGLQEKEKVSYFFKKIDMLDSFWTHIFYMLNEIIEPKNPLFVYNPHEWFAFMRQETDEAIINSTKEKARQILLTVSHDDHLDKELRKTLRSDTLQYNISTKKIFKKDNYYLSVIGDYIIEVFLDEKISKEINIFFKETKDLNGAAQEKLRKIISKNSKNKLIISRNKKKGEEYKRILGKDFYIKK